MINAVILAGGTLKPDDLLYPLIPAGTLKKKALAIINQKPMVQWVLDALGQSGVIGQIVIVGLTDEWGLVCDVPLHFVDDVGSMMGNIEAGIRKIQTLAPTATHTLGVSCDIPALTPAIVKDVVERAEGIEYDLLYHVVAEETMETRFPNSKRSYIALKDARVCGADMNLIANHIVFEKQNMWRKLTDARKNAFKQASIFGIQALFLLLFKRLDLKNGEKYLSKRLGFNCKFVLTPHAEIAMDVDKPEQLALLRADFEKRAVV